MSAIGKRVIYVGPADDANHKPLHIEGIATEAGILPGAVIDYAASGAGLELMDDAATVFGKPLRVADKDQMRTKSVDDAWTVDENMVGIDLRSGEFANVLVASSQALTTGLALTRNATIPGTLVIAAADGTEEILCQSDETVTTTTTQLVRVKKL